MASLPDRPRALTEEVQVEIIAMLRLGMHFSPACYAAGTTPETVKYWEKLYESGAEHAQVYADFFGWLKRAPALAERESLETLKDGDTGWQSRAWFLERRFPARWGKKDKIEVSSNIDPSKMSDEELEAIARGSKKSRR